MLLSPQDKAKVFQWFLDPMTTVFARPRHLKTDDDAAKSLGFYAQALSRFSAPELDAGWHRLMSRHGVSSWPTPAECVALCQEAREALNGRAAVVAPKREERPEEPEPPMDEAAARRMVESIRKAELLPAVGIRLGKMGREFLRRGGFAHLAPPYPKAGSRERQQP